MIFADGLKPILRSIPSKAMGVAAVGFLFVTLAMLPFMRIQVSWAIDVRFKRINRFMVSTVNLLKSLPQHKPVC
jgi:hypothetical protein